jgi:CheY-like chemotaxis protein
MLYGLQVNIVNDAKKCIDTFKNENYGLVFIDLHMPNFDGLEACSVVRQTNFDIPIVALSVAILKDEVQKILDASMNSHPAKPIPYYVINVAS